MNQYILLVDYYSIASDSISNIVQIRVMLFLLQFNLNINELLGKENKF